MHELMSIRRGQHIRRLGLYCILLIPLAYSGVLMASLAVQFSGELPCELCLLQRWSMLLACAGPAFIARRAELGKVTHADVARGLGVATIAATVGGLVSLHQLTLTNLPGHSGFGPAVLGMHTYTWALVTFTLMVLFSAGNMLWLDELTPTGVQPGFIVRIALWVYVLMAALITVLTILQAGLHMDFHTFRYELLYDLGILS